MTDRAPSCDLSSWQERSFTFTDGRHTHCCYEKGDGPRGVILLPEIPGITPEVLGLGQHLVSEGFRVVIPSLFGKPGKPDSRARSVVALARVCVSAEFRAFATNADRPVAAFVRALAADLASRTGAPGVGVIGLCFTGGFALAAAVDDSVSAAVLSQPSVPLPVTAARRADAGASEGELACVQERAGDDGPCLMGLRFSEDRKSPQERFATLSAVFGPAFRVISLSSAPGNSGGFRPGAHSVLTREVRETPGHPALDARAEVVAFLKERLPVPGSPSSAES